MNKLVITLMLASIMPAMAETPVSPELQECMQRNIAAGKTTFSCPEAAKSPQKHMQAAYHKLEQALASDEQRNALAAEQQAWLAFLDKKTAFRATWNGAQTERDFFFRERTRDLEKSLRLYQRMQKDVQ